MKKEMDKIQFVDLKQNTVPYIAVMHFGAWLLFFCERRKITLHIVVMYTVRLFSPHRG